jgi:hypothetical protein
MLLLAVSTSPRIGCVALPVGGRERGRATRLASRARGASPAGGPAVLPSSRSGVPGRIGPDASSRSTGQSVRAARDDPPLASIAARAPMDVSASVARQASDGRRRSCADLAAGAGEPGLGLPADPGRARRARCADRGQHRLQATEQHGVDGEEVASDDPAGIDSGLLQDRPSTAPVIGNVAAVPASPGLDRLRTFDERLDDVPCLLGRPLTRRVRRDPKPDTPAGWRSR